MLTAIGKKQPVLGEALLRMAADYRYGEMLQLLDRAGRVGETNRTGGET